MPCTRQKRRIWVRWYRAATMLQLCRCAFRDSTSVFSWLQPPKLRKTAYTGLGPKCKQPLSQFGRSNPVSCCSASLRLPWWLRPERFLFGFLIARGFRHEVGRSNDAVATVADPLAFKLLSYGLIGLLASTVLILWVVSLRREIISGKSPNGLLPLVVAVLCAFIALLTAYIEVRQASFSSPGGRQLHSVITTEPGLVNIAPTVSNP